MWLGVVGDVIWVVGGGWRCNLGGWRWLGVVAWFSKAHSVFTFSICL